MDELHERASLAGRQTLKPLSIVAFGGTSRANSTGERALEVALSFAREAGAETKLFSGELLALLPHFSPESAERTEAQRDFVESLRRADGVLIASPGYHGGVSGLVKNAIDLLEDLRTDSRVYLDQRAVGCIVTAAGWQAAGITLTAMRGIVHSLRGWPTPLGVMINTTGGPVFDGAGKCIDPKIEQSLFAVSGQVLDFAKNFRPRS